jgi:hypothetical protein
MTDDKIALRTLLEKGCDATFLREMIGFAAQRLMELESKSQVSRLCGEIDERVRTFLSRPVEGEWPYVWLDATYVKARRDHHIVSVAVIVAVGVNTDGRREVLGMTVGHSEAEPFWVEFLRSLARRGLRGAKLVISDAHEGLKAAIVKVLGATWQRCRVHFMRNALAYARPAAPRFTAAAWRYGRRASRSRPLRYAEAVVTSSTPVTRHQHGMPEAIRVTGACDRRPTASCAEIAKIGLRPRISAGDRDLVHNQPLDPVGDHPGDLQLVVHPAPRFVPSVNAP